MNSKKLATRILLCLLALVSMFAVVGCDDGNDKLPTETYIFDKQLNSIRYYFKQGYPDDWTMNQNQDGSYIKKITQYADGFANVSFIQDCGLVAQFSPTAAPDKAKYSVYCLKYPFMRATGGDLLLGLLGKNTDYPLTFNNLFIEDEESKPRDNFVWSEEIDESNISESTVYYNKMTYQKVGYTFTVDGVDWKGMMLVTVSKEGFYVITLETEKGSWDANYSTMEKMLNDFRMRGWETRE